MKRGMDWLTWIVAGGAIAGVLALRRMALIGTQIARDRLKEGAKVIDVRDETEFGQQHLQGAINIPLTRLREEIGRHVPDKDQAVLLHCLSGGRSGIGQAMLRGMGYRKAFNLGSYERASRIVAGQG